jgi:hypothetical protein
MPIRSTRKWSISILKKVQISEDFWILTLFSDLWYCTSQCSKMARNLSWLFRAKHGVNVRYHNHGSKELNACIGFLLHMVYLYPKHKSLLFADNMYEINMHSYIHLQWCFPWSTHPCFHLWLIPFPFAWISVLLYLLEDPSSYERGANIHPLSSLVSYQLSSPCCLTHPKDNPQIKLHIYIDDISSAAPSDTVNAWKKVDSLCILDQSTWTWNIAGDWTRVPHDRKQRVDLLDQWDCVWMQWDCRLSTRSWILALFRFAVFYV